MWTQWVGESQFLWDPGLPKRWPHVPIWERRCSPCPPYISPSWVQIYKTRSRTLWQSFAHCALRVEPFQTKAEPKTIKQSHAFLPLCVLLQEIMIHLPCKSQVASMDGWAAKNLSNFWWSRAAASTSTATPSQSSRLPRPWVEDHPPEKIIPLKLRKEKKLAKKLMYPTWIPCFCWAFFFNLLGLVIPNRPWKELRFAPFAVWEPRETAGSGLACYY